MTETAQVALLREFREDRWLAHRHLFPHRHPDEPEPLFDDAEGAEDEDTEIEDDE